MQDAARFSGSIPRVYDECLGPLLFHWSAEELCARVHTPTDGHVLEIACGTGIATEAIRGSLPDEVRIAATDVNQAMLDVAVARRGNLANVTYGHANAQELPFADCTFDAVVCQFGIMFFPDPIEALREARRVLRPGGQLVYSVWGSLESNPPVSVAHETIRTFFREDPPRFLETPFGLYQDHVLRSLFTTAGFQDIKIEKCARLVELPSARDPAVGLVCGNPGILEIEARGSASTSAVVDAVETALGAQFGTRPFRAPLEAMFLTTHA